MLFTCCPCCLKIHRLLFDDFNKRLYLCGIESNHIFYCLTEKDKMRKNIVAGNWKMNTTVPEGVQLAKDVCASCSC